MNARQRRIVGGLLVVFALCLAAEFASHAQPPQRAGGAYGGQQTGSPAGANAERAQIWNSPNMLRAGLVAGVLSNVG